MMATFYMQISDGIEAEVDIQADNAHEALNAGLNALSKFACKAFPPPDNIAISVLDADRRAIATMQFEFRIDYASGVRI